ncbi:MarR family winged helix-turn-helix transcriptional regulator [Geomicrobium sediminis]|uniref:MarR family 2-MHQ and catechol resistance regulon transcriptional repressor n=1 Tax=Geomicrobium sediminis TaxID=1347788 RepID=A0ABS2PD68_9BACL|nr:MarR family transcriptional regulator [Geomicrobium sediminis]MBM7632901.1 MarR family 2-MHQ and catechol resistance regulon transcriptional repressor [Geomicrobium sediminis]
MTTIEWNQEQALALKLFVVMTRSLESVKRNVEHDIRSHGLNPTEFAVIELLYNKGDQPVQKIGEKVLIASSSITYVVDKLEKRGYTQRKPCPNDRRITFVSITEEGRSFMDEIFPSHVEAIESIMEGLDSEEKEQAIDLLKKLGKSTKL